MPRRTTLVGWCAASNGGQNFWFVFEFVLVPTAIPSLPSFFFWQTDAQLSHNGLAYGIEVMAIRAIPRRAPGQDGPVCDQFCCSRRALVRAARPPPSLSEEPNTPWCKIEDASSGFFLLFFLSLSLP